MSSFNYQKRSYRAACVRWTGDNSAEIIGLFDNAHVFREEYIVIRLPGGVHTLRVGDWVIKGEDGAARFYTHEVFSIKYEAICREI